MITRKIAISLVTIVSALALTAGGTFALFSGQAASLNNTFSTGNANLEIAQDNSGNPGTFGASITGPTFTGLMPGDSKDFFFWLKNVGTSPITLGLTADVSAISGTQVLDQTMLVSWTCDTNHNNSLDESPSSEFSPRSWLDGGNTGIGSVTQNQQMFCKMTGRLPSEANNSVAGQTVDFNAVYDGVQQP